MCPHAARRHFLFRMSAQPINVPTMLRGCVGSHFFYICLLPVAPTLKTSLDDARCPRSEFKASAPFRFGRNLHSALAMLFTLCVHLTKVKTTFVHFMSSSTWMRFFRQLWFIYLFICLFLPKSWFGDRHCRVLTPLLPQQHHAVSERWWHLGLPGRCLARQCDGQIGNISGYCVTYLMWLS